MKKRILIVLLVHCFAINLIYSTGTDKDKCKKLFLDAEYHFLQKNYENALDLYLELLETDPSFIDDNSNINYRIGVCYLFFPDEKYHAYKFLEKAVLDISKKYNEGSFKEKQAPFLAYYYLGKAYTAIAEFEKAVDAFNEYKEFLDAGDLYEIEKTNKCIKLCEDAKYLLLASSHNYVLVCDPGANVNSAGDEYNPVISADAKTLVYMRMKNNETEILFLTENHGKWSEPENIKSQLRADSEFYAVSLSHDGKQLFLTDGKDIYKSEFVNNNWTPVKKLNDNVNSGAEETHAALSPDGKFLYFTSNRKGGFGGLDIYMSGNNGSGDWGLPVNLGSTINTNENEENPNIMENGNELFFCSGGHQNMGGYDIFYSKRLDNNKWSVPINIGYPVNTPEDDTCIYFTGKGNIAYTSLHTREGMGERDIFRLEIMRSFKPIDTTLVGSDTSSANDTLTPVRAIPPVDLAEIRNEKKDEFPLKNNIIREPAKNITDFQVKGRILLKDNKEPDENIKVAVLSNGKSETHDVKVDKSTGTFSLETDFQDFSIEVIHKDYLSVSEYLAFPELYTRSDVIVDFELIPEEVKKKNYYLLSSIFFEPNTTTLNKRSKIELERIYSLLKNNPDMFIEISGYYNSYFNSPQSEKLSKKRARSAINYLVENGINKERFVARTVERIGDNTGVNPWEEPEKISANRRVDMKIIKKNTEQDVIVDNEPDNIKYRDNLFYTVLLLQQGSRFNVKKNIEIKEFLTKEGYIYISGNFKDKSQAIILLNTAIEEGFSGARIISNFEFDNMQESFYEDIKNEIEAENIHFRNTMYTIQLKALADPVDISYFKSMKGVMESMGKDGYYRYTYKEIIGIDKAEKELSKIIDMGYPDAFLMRIERLENISEEVITSTGANTIYTIQLKALIKAVDAEYFKNIPDVKEHIGKDGLYRYTCGEFRKMQFAKKELKNIIEMGYEDAFIIKLENLKNK